MEATNGAKRRTKLVSVTVGGLERETVKRLRAHAADNHRSLAGHIRAIIEEALVGAEAEESK